MVEGQNTKEQVQKLQLAVQLANRRRQRATPGTDMKLMMDKAKQVRGHTCCPYALSLCAGGGEADTT